MSVPYYFVVQDKQLYNYSCDMVRINFTIFEDAIGEFKMWLCDVMRSDITEYPLNFADFKYKYMFKFSYDDNSMILGLSFNGYSKDDVYKGFIEFNPNKCYANRQCIDDVKKIRFYAFEWEIARWDLAIDLPFARDDLRLVKDERKRELVEYSAKHKTEYLGARNSVGRVKLYNKALELGLNCNLVRLEITLGDIEFDSRYIDRYFPTIFTLDAQKSIDFSDLSQNDKVLVELLNDCEDFTYYFKKLNAYKRVKLKPYLIQDNSVIKYDFSCILKVCDFIKSDILYKL